MMNGKHRRVLEAIFARPLLRTFDGRTSKASCGARADARKGAAPASGFLLNGAEAVFHRPHPKPETNKGAVVSVREFLKMAGVEP